MSKSSTRSTGARLILCRSITLSRIIAGRLLIHERPMLRVIGLTEYPIDLVDSMNDLANPPDPQEPPRQAPQVGVARIVTRARAIATTLIISPDSEAPIVDNTAMNASAYCAYLLVRLRSTWFAS